MTAHVGGTAYSSSPAAVPPVSCAADKHRLRREIQSRRAALSKAQRAAGARRCARFAARALIARKVRTVAIYLAYRSEMSTAPLIDLLLAHGIRIVVPRLRGRSMKMIELGSRTCLRRNRFGIAEACGRHHLGPRQLDAIVMPLTGYDAKGHRLGSGGGYYDRFLANSRLRHRPWRLGYGYSVQQCEDVPADPWDITLHAICTERGLHPFAAGTDELAAPADPSST